MLSCNVSNNLLLIWKRHIVDKLSSYSFKIKVDKKYYISVLYTIHANLYKWVKFNSLSLKLESNLFKFMSTIVSE